MMRTTLDFNDNWYFHKGDFPVKYPEEKMFVYMSSKTECMLQGPACKDYTFMDKAWDGNIELNGDIWEKVSLPHDYLVGGVPQKDLNCAFGYLPRDNGWYVKRFNLSKEDKNKRLTLIFEGVGVHSTIYLNGCLVKRNFSSYNTFEADITNFVKFDSVNHLAVYTQAKDIHEGWWYEGAGIHRPVSLVKAELLSIDLWGIYAKPVLLDDGSWRVETTTTVRNDYDKQKSVKIVGEIIDDKGKTIAMNTANGLIKSYAKRELSYDFTVKSPKLWSPEEPNRYTMKASLYQGDLLIDEQQVKFGFRTFKTDADNGLFINGKPYKIKGVCGHADCGLTGRAVPDNINRYKVTLLKEMGANGYRTSHYMQQESLMEALDENGFIVMDETRWFSTTDEALEQLTTLVKRDRNRPSVFFWSIGNEEPHHQTEEGRRIAKKMMDTVRKLDDTRPVMTAVTHSPQLAPVCKELDVVGVNYNWQHIDETREKYPHKAMVSSECAATGTTRGWYNDDDLSKGYISGYDHDIDKTFISRENTWKFIAERPWMMGGYQWTAFEYRGESVWPRLCSQSGAIDLFLQKKDAFYQNQSHWLDKPVLHILPHWNFIGMEGKIIKVWTYTNVQQVELFLNGVSLGKKTVEKYGHGEWQVPYVAGSLKAIGYIDGKEVIQDEVVTTKKGKKLRLNLDTPDVKANGKDIAIFTCTVLDEDGLAVPDASPTVSFHAEGAGRVYSTGSDISDHTPLLLSERKMRAGRIGVAVKLNDKKGVLRLIATSDGLESACIEINVD